MDERNGVGAGFDLLRLELALGVIVYHAFGVAASAEFVGHWQILAESIVPAFFVISGFLVTGAALRSTPSQFAINRASRILPALIVVVILSALVWGPILTTLDLPSYFSSPETWKYLLSMAGITQMELPGVFSQPHLEGSVLASMHAEGSFNVSLWTVGWELICYAMVALLLLGRLLERPGVVLSLFVAVMSFRLGLYLDHPSTIHVQNVSLGPIVFPGFEMHNLTPDELVPRWSPDWFANRIALHFTSWEFRVIPFFLAGMLLYLWRHDVPRTRGLAFGSAAVLLLVSLVFSGQASTPVTTFLTALPIAYLVGYLGTSEAPLPGILKGDYSYGVYLWAFPIQQTIHLYGLDGGSPWGNVVLTFPFALLAGCLSWHLIELPALAKRRFRFGRFQALANG